MPNDAKFGLVVGVGLVIAVAIVFFRKDAPTPTVEPTPAPAAKTGRGSGASPKSPAPAGGGSSQRGTIRARTMIHTTTPEEGNHAPATFPSVGEQAAPENHP